MRKLFLLVMAIASTVPAHAGLITTLDQNQFTAAPGGQFTITGFFTVTDTVTLQFVVDYLNGLTPPFPLPPLHLGIVGGTVEEGSLSINGSFLDVLEGGYLGPTVIDGPTVTADSSLRTFVVPANAQPGVYTYIYSFPWLVESGSFTGGFQGATFTVDVIPEPGTLVMTMSAFFLIAAWSWRRRRPTGQWRKLPRSSIREAAPPLDDYLTARGRHEACDISAVMPC